ncbi:hypothetical protein [Rhizobium sp. MHM7A]|nr:hypothetical protein [Rhizobium sp. MHM7A]
MSDKDRQPAWKLPVDEEHRLMWHLVSPANLAVTDKPDEAHP